jgi:hypothetical protein
MGVGSIQILGGSQSQTFPSPPSLPFPLPFPSLPLHPHPSPRKTRPPAALDAASPEIGGPGVFPPEKFLKKYIAVREF